MESQNELSKIQLQCSIELLTCLQGERIEIVIETDGKTTSLRGKDVRMAEFVIRNTHIGTA